jgi:hypothetical protein
MGVIGLRVSNVSASRAAVQLGGCAALLAAVTGHWAVLWMMPLGILLCRVANSLAVWVDRWLLRPMAPTPRRTVPTHRSRAGK